MKLKSDRHQCPQKAASSYIVIFYSKIHAKLSDMKYGRMNLLLKLITDAHWSRWLHAHNDQKKTFSFVPNYW